jgi:ribosomal protein S6--L-glutamate ligase
MKNKVGVLVFHKEEKKNEYTDRFIEEIKKAGLTPEVFYYYKFSIYFKQNTLEIFYNNKKMNFKNFLFFISRYSFCGEHIHGSYSLVDFLSKTGIPFFNSLKSSILGKNKRDSLIKLALADIPITPTGINYSHFFLDQHLNKNKTGKYVVKLNSSSLGNHVALVESKISFISFMEFFGSSKPHAADLLIQPYIDSDSTDYRIFVVGNKVVAGMKRKGSGIEFRSNVAKGGNGKQITPTKKMADLAVRAAKILKLDYAGVDIIKDKKGKIMVIEVNPNPGLEIEKITNTNVVAKIVKHCIKKSK